MSNNPTTPAQIAERMSEAQKRNLLALPKRPGVWLTVSEMRGNGATGAGMDVLHVMLRRLCDRRWTRWGGGPGQKRGEGYEYAITEQGLAVRDHLLSREASTQALSPLEGRE